MIMVRRVVPADWEALRDIRLAALSDAPDAFGSTYAEQVAFTKQDWLERISDSPRFLAFLDHEDEEPNQAQEPSGLVGGYLSEPGVVELISMWVHPRGRGRGVGEALIDAILAWARDDQRAATLHLWVTETNKPAIRLYERKGFTPTGERQPLPSNPDLPEIAMSRKL